MATIRQQVEGTRCGYMGLPYPTKSKEVKRRIAIGRELRDRLMRAGIKAYTWKKGVDTVQFLNSYSASERKTVWAIYDGFAHEGRK